jgi:ABC-2 type transport system permease protein
MPASMQSLAENQPFTAFNETLRGLLMGTPIGNSGLLTTVWRAAIAAGGYLWARGLYNRNSAR